MGHIHTMEKFSKLAGKWTKINHSGFEEFAAKAGPAAEGADADDIKTCFELKQDQMICKFSVGGTPEMSVMYNYDSPCENEMGGMKYTAEGHVKEERYQFHGPNRMIVETIANDAVMITT